MVGDITIYIWLAVGAFVTTIITSIVSGILMKGNEVPAGTQTGKAEVYLKMWFFGLFLLIGFSIVPIAVKLFTDRLVVTISESDIPKIIRDNSMTVVYVSGLFILSDSASRSLPWLKTVSLMKKNRVKTDHAISVPFISSYSTSSVKTTNLWVY